MTCDRCNTPSIYSPCGPCQIVAASEHADLYRIQKATPVVPDRYPTYTADSPLWHRDLIPEPAPDWYAAIDPTGTQACG